MPALFTARSTTILRTVLVLVPALGIVGLASLWIFVRTPFVTARGWPVEQPVAFDHRHHVVDDGIDCLFCHIDAERSAYAGIPPTELCMGCHAQIWNDGPSLAPVRASWTSGQPIPWVRVHDLPDFTFFDHSIHVHRGFDCARCHGRVEDMARVHQEMSLTMGWCLDCHRDQGGPTYCSACHR